MDIVKERYSLCAGRLKEIAKEKRAKDIKENKAKQAFAALAERYTKLMKLYDLMKSGYEKKTFEELKAFYDELYCNVKPENYGNAYENPEYAVKTLGSKLGKLITMLFARSYTAGFYAAELDLESFVMEMESVVEVYCLYEGVIAGDLSKADDAFKEAKTAFRSFMTDNVSFSVERHFKNRFDPEHTCISDIVRTRHKDLKYLYAYGEYITDIDLETAGFVSSLSEKVLKQCADTYVDGYIRGFKTTNSNFKKDGIVTVYYPIGFEAIMYYAVKRFEEMGVKCVAFRASFSSRSGRAGGVAGTAVNPQFYYDHRNDYAFYYDKLYAEKTFEAEQNTAERLKKLLALHNGPAVVESFGTPDFVPVNKKECFKLTARQKEIENRFDNRYMIMMDRYMPESETSFTIIAYPLPSIGKDFKAVFEDTIKINNLDNAEYIKMQQCIIDILDKGERVHIKGTNGNETDITVELWKLKDPKKETIFENCTADVNIPVGEVFTSPVLKGTNGLLHVSKVFLNGLEYKDLKVRFKDGMTTELSVNNFKTEKENQDLLKERLLFNHESLPLGEFAIGTNTVAFAMAQKYGIQAKLPILIAEKTGPHFAIGDTCYSQAEDHKVYNPDGKEIVARENECSAKRASDPEKAYFGCHTDITIPYDEIGEIASVRADGSTVPIIKNGRFVVKGTEKLNEALEK